MADLDMLFDSVDKLTPEEIKQLYTYILEHHVQFTKGEQQSVEPLKPRVLGLHAHLDEAWMSDDFGDELPDAFWLGEM
jgi:hypothetical protein